MWVKASSTLKWMFVNSSSSLQTKNLSFRPQHFFESLQLSFIYLRDTRQSNWSCCLSLIALVCLIDKFRLFVVRSHIKAARLGISFIRCKVSFIKRFVRRSFRKPKKRNGREMTLGNYLSSFILVVGLANSIESQQVRPLPSTIKAFEVFGTYPNEISLRFHFRSYN